MNNELSNFTNEQFQRKAKKALLQLSEDKSMVAEPTAYILGGQPGAGKTALQKVFREQCDKNVIIINGDEFRRFHPKFDKIQKEYGKDAAQYTQKFSGEMTEHVINKLSDDKYNLIIEGTLRTAAVPLNSQKMLEDKGYKTELSVIAVKPEISYLGTISRYEDMYALGVEPRATPKDHHDKVVEAILSNLNEIYQSNKFDNITIYDRSGECLYNQKATPQINPKDIISETFTREWTDKEIKNLKNDIEKITKNMKNRNAPELNEFKQHTDELI